MYPPCFEYSALAISVEAYYRLCRHSVWKDLVANATVAAGDHSSYYDGYLLFLIQYKNGIKIDDMARSMDFPDDYFKKLGITVNYMFTLSPLTFLTYRCCICRLDPLQTYALKYHYVCRCPVPWPHLLTTLSFTGCRVPLASYSYKGLQFNKFAQDNKPADIQDPRDIDNPEMS